MRRSLLILALAALVLGACGDSEQPSRDSGGSTSTRNPAGSIADVGPEGDRGGPPTTSATNSGGTVTTGGTGGTGTTRASGAGASTTVARASGAYQPTQPGTYTYHTSGKASSPGFGERPINADDTQRFDPPSGSDQRSTRQDQGGTNEQVLRYGNDGIRLVSQKITSQSVTKEFRPNPPVLYFPYPLKKGQEWSWRMTSTDGATTVDGKFKYVRDETVNVGGESVPTYVIDATVNTSGDITTTSKQTFWASPSLRLTIQEHNVTDGKFGEVTFHSETTRKLKSTKPA